jgi:hypothetical protein
MFNVVLKYNVGCSLAMLFLASLSRIVVTKIPYDD